MPTLRPLRTAAALALLSSSPAFAAPYVGSALEDFSSYTAGNIVNSFAGGTGWNATGDALAPNTTTWGVTLTPGGTAFTGSGPVFLIGATAANNQITTGAAALITGAGQAGRNFGQNVDSGTFYFAYTVKKTVENVRTVNFSLFGDNGSTANPNERIAFGQVASNVQLRSPDGSADPAAATKANQGKFAALVQAGAAQAGGTFTSGTYPAGNTGIYTAATEQSFTLNETFLVVCKIEFNYAGGNGFDDRVTYYLNPASLTNESAATPYIILDKFNIGTLVGFRMFAGGSVTNFPASAAEFDNIRLGTTYASVTGAPIGPVSPYQTWLNLHFTAPEQGQSAISGETADPDGDGRANLLEYALGTAPRATDTVSALLVRAPAGFLSLDYPVPAADLTYTPETSTDLTTWVTTGITDISASPGLRTATVPQPTTGRAFLRLRVSRVQ
jgi:hypothetical protein